MKNCQVLEEKSLFCNIVIYGWKHKIEFIVGDDIKSEENA